MELAEEHGEISGLTPCELPCLSPRIAADGTSAFFPLRLRSGRADAVGIVNLSRSDGVAIEPGRVVAGAGILDRQSSEVFSDFAQGVKAGPMRPDVTLRVGFPLLPLGQ